MGATNRQLTGIARVFLLSLAVTLAVAGCVHNPQSPTTTPTVTSAGWPNPSAPAEDSHEADIYSPGPALAKAPAEATAVVDGFARAWARPGVPADTWWTGVAVWCEPGLAARLKTTDPANVPAAKVIGPPRPTGVISADAITYTVAADTGTITIGVISAKTRWLVTSVDFTRSVAR
jgi:hypothetical protein